MDFTINHKLFKEALKKVEKGLSAKHPIPILQGFYMEVTEQEMILITSDSDDSYRFHVPIDGENLDVIKPGKAVLPKSVYEVVKKLKKDIHFELKDFILNVKSGKSEFDFNILDAEEYPKLPDIDLDNATLSLKGKEFHDLISKTAFAASSSETRPVLTGVCMELSQTELKVVCTDSHRLGKVNKSIDVDKASKYVIPAKSLDKFLKTADLLEDVLVYCNSDNQIVFRNGALLYYCRLLQGNYPDTARLIPSDFKAEMKVSRMEFLEGLELVENIANSAQEGKGGTVKLHVNGAATISSYQAQTGKGSVIVEYESLDGEDDFTISFSARYAIEALKTIEDDFVCFKFQGDMRPFLFTPVESELNEIQLILPVRTY